MAITEVKIDEELLDEFKTITVDRKPKKKKKPSKSYEEFKKIMIDSFGEERWEVIESFVWTEQKAKADKVCSSSFGTLSILMESVLEDDLNWWQDDIGELG